MTHTLTTLAASLALATFASAAPHDINTHTFKDPYVNNRVLFWKHGAGAYVNESYIRLTPPRQSRTGFMWNEIPSVMTAWEVQFNFKVGGLPHIGGDGFAFWYAKTPQTLGSVYGSADYWTGLGVFFDTYNNDGAGQTPLITAQVNDGTDKFDADRDGESRALGKCSYDFRNLATPSRAKIKYQNNQLSVSIALDANSDPDPCFQISNVNLGVDMYFGLTAHTGEIADSHDIYNFIVKDLSAGSQDLDAVRREYNKQIEKSHLRENHHLNKDEFQSTAITILHQLQDSVKFLEHAISIQPMSLGNGDAVDLEGLAKNVNQLVAGSQEKVLSELRSIRSNIGGSAPDSPPVDRNFIQKQIQTVKGEIATVTARSKSLSDELSRLSTIRSQQSQILAAIQNLEKVVNSVSARSGGSWLGASLGYLLYLALAGGVAGACVYGYKHFQGQRKGVRSGNPFGGMGGGGGSKYL